MSVDLNGEMLTAAGRVRQPHIDRLLALGVPGVVIATLGGHQIPFGVGTVERMERGLYQPGDGPLHVLSPVCEAGEIIDIIAWRSDAPGNWAWRTGLGWALGTDMLLPRWDDDPVQLHATPLDWLRAGGTGMCILDWEAPELGDLHALEAIEADEWTAQRLTRALSKPRRIPTIIKRKEVRRAA
ncbi:MAG: hypothetical protein AB7E60_14660 [Sphingobium sp.]